jgi:hypothetical protein
LFTGSDKKDKLRSPIDRAIIELLKMVDSLNSWPPTRGAYGIDHSVSSSVKPKEIRYFLRSYKPPESDRARFEYLDVIRDALIETGKIEPSIFHKQYSSQVITNHLIRLADRQMITKQNVGYSIGARSYTFDWDLDHIKQKVSAIDDQDTCFVHGGMILYNSKRRSLSGINEKHIDKQHEFEEYLDKQLMELQHGVRLKLKELYGKPKESLYDFHCRFLNGETSPYPSMIIIQPRTLLPMSDDMIAALKEARKEIEEKYPELRDR